MAMTTLGDLFATNRAASIAVMQSFADRDPVTRTPFVTSGAMSTHPAVDMLLSQNDTTGNGVGSLEITLPFWGNIDPSVEPNYSSDVYQDIAVPRSIGMGSQKARLVHLNEGFGEMSFAREVSGLDPLQRVAEKLDTYWSQEAELRAVATLRGLLADNIADNGGDMRHDIAAAAPDANALIDAQATMGDAFGDLALCVMHSKLYFKFAKAGLTAESTDPNSNRLTRTVAGVPAIVNDNAMQVTVGGTAKHAAAFLGRDAIAYGIGKPRRDALEYDREPARGNGGGAETLWTRRNMVVHPLGYSFLSASITGNGSETVARGAGWTDLANAANWQRVSARKQIPIAFLLSNA